MIKLSRINGKEFFLNAEIIEYIEASPDTVITLINGKTVMVRDSLEEVAKKFLSYKRKILLRRDLKKGCEKSQ